MSSFLLPVAIVVAIGILAGLLLSFASKFMSVPTDEKAQKILECLPGANCGGCGYSGCEGYAAAVAEGKASPDKCAAGGEKTAAALSELLGVKIDKEKKVAFITCGGNPDITETRYNYEGMKSCAAANRLHGGPNECEFGCLGFGDCMRACPFGAISVKNGRPFICEELCKACGKCVSVCPKHIIKLVPKGSSPRVNCANCKKGPAVVKACKVSCIACGMCEKACPSGAVKVINNLAVIDPALCTGCGECKKACRRGVII